MGEGPAPRRAGRPSVSLARPAILRAARIVFAREGYGGATLDAIADSLGVRKASLLHHFASKEALYSEAVLDLFGELKQRVIEALAAETAAPLGFAERIDLLSDSVTAYLYRNPEAAALIIRELTRPVDDRPGTGRAADTLRIMAGMLGSGFEGGGPWGGDPAHLLLSIMGLHLVYFAVAPTSSAVLGYDVYGPGAEQRRAAEVRLQVRALVGLATTPGPG